MRMVGRDADFWSAYTARFGSIVDAARDCPWMDYARTNAAFPKDYVQNLAPERTEWPRYQLSWLAIRAEAARLGRCCAVLDVGMQFGFFAASVLGLNCEVHSTDDFEFYGTGLRPVRELLETMGVRLAPLNRSSPYALPFPADSMDVVSFLAVIEHLPDSPRFLLEEIRRVLKPSGLLLVDTPNASALSNRLSYLVKGVPPTYFAIDALYDSEIPFTGHHREYAPEELRYVLTRSGFQIERQRFLYAGTTRQSLQRALLQQWVPLLKESWYPCQWVSCRNGA